MKKGFYVVVIALFASLISAGTFIQIPLPGGIPITFQDMFAMLAGLILGPVAGGAAVLVFLLLGILGLPVFTGKAGLHVLIAGPTSGFLFGYLLTAVLGGLFLNLLLRQNKQYSNLRQIISISVVAVFQQVLLFTCAIIGFSLVTQKDISAAVAAVLLPFIPGNVLKIFIMVPMTKIFRPKIQEL